MSSDTRPSAKIYQFPRKPVVRINATSGQTAGGRASPTPRVEFGGGWYHEAAIKAEQQRKP